MSHANDTLYIRSPGIYSGGPYRTPKLRLRNQRRESRYSAKFGIK